jgi:hypothetical protein
LRIRWSLQAKVLVWVLGAFELLLLGFLGHRWPWLWLLSLFVPLLAWFMHRQGRNLQSTIIVFLDQLAKDLNLSKLQPNSSPHAPPPQAITITPSTLPGANPPPEAASPTVQT